MVQAQAEHDERRVHDALGRLAIFPLPGAVLLPHGLVPLHVFEPRYRKMMRDCLDGAGVLALAQLAPGPAPEGGAEPRVLPVIGAGVFDHVEPLPDGRFNLVLRGVLRARIVEELPAGQPYRLVRAEPLREDPLEALRPEAQEAAEALRQMVLGLCAAMPGPGAQRLLHSIARAADPSALADVVAATLVESPRERQRLLEELSVLARLSRVSGHAAGLLARAAPRGADKALLN